MKRKEFIQSLGIMAAASMMPEKKPEKLTLPAHTSNADYVIGTQGVERMRISASGNVCMGTTTPGARLLVINPSLA